MKNNDYKLNTTKQIRFCSNCGHELIANSVFCSNCGTKINNCIDKSQINNSNTHDINSQYNISEIPNNKSDNIKFPLNSFLDDEQRKQTKKHSGCAFLILIFLILFIIMMSIFAISAISEIDTGNTNQNQNVSTTSVAKIEKKAQVPVTDFEYKIEGNIIKLIKYNGKAKTLYIKPIYEIKGQSYTTDLSDFTLGVGNSKVNYLIIGEGINKINTYIFNSCDIKCVYFPKSLEIVYDYTLSYFHPDDGEKIDIYYGGTESEWNNIFTKYERQTVSEAWNSSDDAEEKGAAVGGAIADKLNNMMGGYDSLNFEYHYKSSVTNVLEIISKSE